MAGIPDTLFRFSLNTSAQTCIPGSNSGFLYEVTTYQQSAEWLADILRTWRFKVSIPRQSRGL
jgi:hypothetical protein